MKLKQLINTGRYHIVFMDYSEENYKDYLKKLIEYNRKYNLMYPIIMLGCAAIEEGDSDYELYTYFNDLNSLRVSQRTMPSYGTAILQCPTFFGPDFIKICNSCKGSVVLDDDELKIALGKMGCLVWEYKVPDVGDFPSLPITPCDINNKNFPIKKSNNYIDANLTISPIVSPMECSLEGSDVETSHFEEVSDDTNNTYTLKNIIIS